MSQPTPDARLHERLSHLGPEGLRKLDAALDRAQAKARISRRLVSVEIEFEVGGEGIVAVVVPDRIERRVESCGGAT